jgi:hypothetical protein
MNGKMQRAMKVEDVFEVDVDFFAFLLFCFSAFLLFCFSAFLLFCF